MIRGVGSRCTFKWSMWIGPPAEVSSIASNDCLTHSVLENIGMVTRAIPRINTPPRRTVKMMRHNLACGLDNGFGSVTLKRLRLEHIEK
jgi:hypothetical protein